MKTTEVFEKTKAEVADKVRKLLAQAEDPAATPHEAQAFTMKAQQLMTKYSIELAMVADATKSDALVEGGWPVSGPYAGHKVTLFNAVARANDCRAIYADLAGGRKHLHVVGYAADVEWTEVLSKSLEVQLGAALLDAMGKRPAGVHGRTYAVGFIQGFIAEISERLQQARRDAVDAAEAAHASGPGGDKGGCRAETRSVALVLVAKQSRVEAEFTVRHPRTRTVYQSVRLQSWSGYDPGRAAGRRASLAKGAVGDERPSLTA